ncbi:MAG: DUF4037 domain-containing protein [Spirochaetia bacterium]|jgi:hypothetical protein
MEAPRPFIPGLVLGRAFFHDVAQGIVESVVPPDAYAAAFMGHGSDVLGYDSERSTDHNWGPRFQLFLSDDLHAARAEALDAELTKRLPHAFHGYPVSFSDPDPQDNGTQVPVPSDEGPVHHLVEITTIKRYLERHLGRDVRDGIGVMDWLTFPEQRLIELTSGEVFHDPRQELARLRETLGAYPRDVWLYKMACQWQRLSQEEAFVGRCAEAGDMLGVKITSSRIVRDLMRLCFLMERRLAPYDKWLGTAFARLHCSAAVAPHLKGALMGATYAVIEENLAELYRIIAGMHNALGVTGPLDASPRHFFGRPYLVIRAERFANALLRAIECDDLRLLAVRMGAIDQFVDCTDYLDTVGMYAKTRELYRQG